MNHPYSGQSSNLYSNGHSYTPQQTNRSTYQHGHKVPETIMRQSSPTQQKAYLQRNQSFQNRQYNEQLIQLIAKIRSLQDDLLNQRFKNESLQRKLTQQSRIIGNLQYELNCQSYQLQKYVHQIQLSNQKNIEILKYEQNLKIVGEQIQQLNDILTKRNADYDLVCEENKELVSDINKIIEENNLMNVRVNIWMREIEQLVEENKEYMMERNIVGNNSKLVNNTGNGTANKNDNKSVKTPSPSKNKNSNIYSPQNPNKFESSSFRQYPPQQQQQSSLTFENSNIMTQMSKKIELLKTLCTSYSKQIHQLHKTHQNQRIQANQQLMTQKQKYIKLQYDHKLLQQRIKDNQKKKQLMSIHYNQQRYEQKLNQMLNKEDEYIATIQHLTQQNQRLTEQLSTTQQNHQYLQQISTKEKQSIIKSLQQQNHLLQQTISELTSQLHQIRQKLNLTEQHYNTLIDENQSYTHENNQQMSKLNKKIRKLQEQNYQYQINIQQLNSEIILLQKQLTLIKQGEIQQHAQQQ